MPNVTGRALRGEMTPGHALRVFFIGVTVVLGALWANPSQAGQQDEKPADGKALFTRYCAACHGEKGDGAGPAARFLYPKPRDFTRPSFRLVTTTNLKPSDEDLMGVITRGMPGSAMFPFGHLSQEDRTNLVGYVRSLMKAGIVETLRKEAEEAGDKPVQAEMEKAADAVLKPAEVIKLPADMPASNPESIARGQAFYKTGCAACHGETGKGDGTQNQKNDDGMPTSPRDFTRGIFKGSREPLALYARIALGMPGSPMPATINLKPSEMGDMVNFILSLPPPGIEKKAEHRRTTIVAKRVEQMGKDIADEVWQAAPMSPIIVTPLWWRVFPDPNLEISAVHDGNTIAIRLTWVDASRNDQPLRPEDFEDKAAIQLFKGRAEPFLGMGAAGDVMDLWQWRASWHSQGQLSKSLLDEYPFDTPTYRDLLKGKHNYVPDFETARAAGNQTSHGDKAQTASSLVAVGFGSVTFRPKASQFVSATSSWKDGRWTVVLRRPLPVPRGEGVALKSGETASVAFALWDGASKDRNGQKLISIWHDLALEK